MSKVKIYKCQTCDHFHCQHSQKHLFSLNGVQYMMYREQRSPIRLVHEQTKERLRQSRSPKRIEEIKRKSSEVGALIDKDKMQVTEARTNNLMPSIHVAPPPPSVPTKNLEASVSTTEVNSSRRYDQTFEKRLNVGGEQLTFDPTATSPFSFTPQANTLKSTPVQQILSQEKPKIQILEDYDVRPSSDRRLEVSPTFRQRSPSQQYPRPSDIKPPIDLGFDWQNRSPEKQAFSGVQSNLSGIQSSAMSYGQSAFGLHSMNTASAPWTTGNSFTNPPFKSTNVTSAITYEPLSKPIQMPQFTHSFSSNYPKSDFFQLVDSPSKPLEPTNPRLTPPDSSSLKKMTDLNSMAGVYTHSGSYPATDLFGAASRNSTGALGPTLTSPNIGTSSTFKTGLNIASIGSSFVPSNFSHQFYSDIPSTSAKTGDFGTIGITAANFPSSTSNIKPVGSIPMQTYAPTTTYHTTSISNYNTGIGTIPSTFGNFGPSSMLGPSSAFGPSTSSLGMSSGKKLFDISPPKYGTSHITYTPIQHFSSPIVPVTEKPIGQGQTSKISDQPASPPKNIPQSSRQHSPSNFVGIVDNTPASLSGSQSGTINQTANNVSGQEEQLPQFAGRQNNYSRPKTPGEESSEQYPGSWLPSDPYSISISGLKKKQNTSQTSLINDPSLKTIPPTTPGQLSQISSVKRPNTQYKRPIMNIGRVAQCTLDDDRCFGLNFNCLSVNPSQRQIVFDDRGHRKRSIYK